MFSTKSCRDSNWNSCRVGQECRRSKPASKLSQIKHVCLSNTALLLVAGRRTDRKLPCITRSLAVMLYERP
jgi:hypothetical protein